MQSSPLGVQLCAVPTTPLPPGRFKGPSRLIGRPCTSASHLDGSLKSYRRSGEGQLLVTTGGGWDSSLLVSWLVLGGGQHSGGSPAPTWGLASQAFSHMNLPIIYVFVSCLLVARLNRLGKGEVVEVF